MEFDVYKKKSETYFELPWVADAKILDFALPDIKAFSGVIDLGCGPGVLGAYVSRFPTVRYIGIEKCPAMLRRAQKLLRSMKPQLILADITSYHSPAPLSNFVCVIKNVLHLVPGYLEFLNSTKIRLGMSRMVIIETVSPDVTSQQWVKNLFEYLPTRKTNWFLCGQLNKELSEHGFKIIRNAYFEQGMNVQRWLQNFGTTSAVTRQLLEMIEAAPSEVKRAMKIKCENGQYFMTRLQNILEIVF